MCSCLIRCVRRCVIRIRGLVASLFLVCVVSWSCVCVVVSLCILCRVLLGMMCLCMVMVVLRVAIARDLLYVFFWVLVSCLLFVLCCCVSCSEYLRRILNVVCLRRCCVLRVFSAYSVYSCYGVSSCVRLRCVRRGFLRRVLCMRMFLLCMCVARMICVLIRVRLLCLLVLCSV